MINKNKVMKLVTINPKVKVEGNIITFYFSLLQLLEMRIGKKFFNQTYQYNIEINGIPIRHGTITLSDDGRSARMDLGKDDTLIITQGEPNAHL